MNKKEINYLGRDFSQFRDNLIEFAKSYFPNTYNDFNESSPGMMIMEMSSYIGDVLSYYTDYQFKENLLSEAAGKANILSIARSMGYQSKNLIPATVDLDVYIIIPARINVDTQAYEPDLRYALTVNTGMRIATEKGIEFRTLESVNFAQSSKSSPTEITVYQINDQSKEPEFYLLKKTVKAIAGNLKTKTFDFGKAKRYDKIVIEEDNHDIVEVVEITDADDNTWAEVPFLAQDILLQPIANTKDNDPDLYVYSDTAPYLLKPKKTARRFITRFNSTNDLEIQFGSGVSDISDEELIPNPDNIGTALLGLQKQFDFPIDPSNFVYTKTYGLAPGSTTLTVRYTTGGGINSNVSAGSITEIIERTFTLDDEALDNTLVNNTKQSLAVINTYPASGGRSTETIDEIRQNALALFSSQQRAVTKEDYLIRCYAMPPKYGSVAKAYVTQDDNINTDTLTKDRVPNPLALNLYTLGYTDSGKLTPLNSAIKHNLQNYIKQYRMLTDAVNIKDAFIINIGVLFDIVTLPNYNSNEVLIKCISKLKETFDIMKWKIGQPIIISKLYVDLDKVEGVQTVQSIKIVNLFDPTSGYSGNVYNINEATKDGIIYPSLDPSIFEIRNLDSDIIGKVVTL
jgi:predicted component of type VI protein secretion system